MGLIGFPLPTAPTLRACIRSRSLSCRICSIILMLPYPRSRSQTAPQRQEAYAWLFKTHSQHKQDVRVRILLEEDAFDRVLEDWRRQGYPFNHLVPSLSTAIGSSGDRPDALAQLIGIVLDGGVRKPIVDLARLAFAVGTPYETVLSPQCVHAGTGDGARGRGDNPAGADRAW